MDKFEYSTEDYARDLRDKDATQKLAALMCEYLESKNTPIPDYAQEWWKKHKRRQQAIVEQQERAIRLEALRLKAMESLSPEEQAELKQWGL